MDHSLGFTRPGITPSISIHREISPLILVRRSTVTWPFSPTFSDLRVNDILFFLLEIDSSVCLALTHIPVASRVTISNTVVIGSVSPGDCNDTIDQNSLNIRLSLMASPKVSDSSSFNGTSGRSGIVFPQMSRNNYIPIRSWTGIGIYPSRN